MAFEEVQRYINKRIDEGAARETIRKELCTLRRALQGAFDRGLLRREPARIIPKFKAPYVPRTRHLTAEEFKALLALLPEEHRHWLRVAVYTGGRHSEIHALRWEEHVNLVNGTILLPGTKTKGSRRTFAIPPPLMKYFRSVRERTGPVVVPWRNVRRDLAAKCKNLGIQRVSPNDLRRTFASWMKQAGVDSMAVARLLGHTTSRMVELVYGHLNDETLKNAVSTLPELPKALPKAPKAKKKPPKSGSKWVVETGAGQRQPRQMQQTLPKKINKLTVPRGGIEPPTRGFSVLCSTD